MLRLFGRPLNYVHLSFPDAIQGTSLRTAMRVKVDIPAQLSYRDVAAVPVFIVNLSVSGALIEAPSMLTPDDEGVALSFTLLVPAEQAPDARQYERRIQNVSVGKPSNGKPQASLKSIRTACNSSTSNRSTTPCCKT